jgi:serine/threonine-protein kinase SRPK3
MAQMADINAGPSLRSFSEAPGKISGYKRLHPQLARSFSRHVAEGLAYLHAIGIVHGDLTPSNILVSMDSIQTMSEQELLELIGQPLCEDVHLNNVGLESILQLPDSAPAYVVAPCDIMAVYQTSRTCRALVTDLNLSHISEVTQGGAALPVEDLGQTSVSYAAPELFFGSQSSFSSDIWSLACVLYAICAGRDMFESFFGTRDEVLQQIVQSLGPLPDEMWIRWEARKHFVTKDGSFQKMARDLWPLDSLRKVVEDIGVCDEGKDIIEQAPSMTVTGDARLSQRDVTELLELLDKALIYDPAARPTATSLLRCAWLS